MEPTPDAILTVLEELGSTGPQVAQTLKDRGFKGIPGCPWRCPIAKYLQSYFPNGDICVGAHIWMGTTSIEIPEPIATFITAFDKT